MAVELRPICTSQRCAKSGLVLTTVFRQREAVALLSSPDSQRGRDGPVSSWPGRKVSGRVAGVFLKVGVLCLSNAFVF